MQSRRGARRVRACATSGLNNVGGHIDTNVTDRTANADPGCSGTTGPVALPSQMGSNQPGIPLMAEGRGSGQGAGVDASGYLYTIATVGMTFAGLSVLTMILRQMLGG